MAAASPLFFDALVAAGLIYTYDMTKDDIAKLDWRKSIMSDHDPNMQLDFSMPGDPHATVGPATGSPFFDLNPPNKEDLTIVHPIPDQPPGNNHTGHPPPVHPEFEESYQAAGPEQQAMPEEFPITEDQGASVLTYKELDPPLPLDQAIEEDQRISDSVSNIPDAPIKEYLIDDFLRSSYVYGHNWNMLVLGQKGSYDDAVKDAASLASLLGVTLGPPTAQPKSKKNPEGGTFRAVKINGGEVKIVVRSASSGGDATIEIQIKGDNPDKSKGETFIYTIKKRYNDDDNKYMNKID